MSAWAAPGFAAALEDVARTLAATPWPGPPAGFAFLTSPRAMRAVLAGALPSSGGSGGSVPVVVKWHRPLSWRDRLARRLVGGRGPREAAVLRGLRARGFAVPEPLAAADGEVDVLVTRRLTGLTPLPPAARAPRALVGALAGFLARLHAAGLVHRDLTAANVALAAGAPVLVDLGGARLAATASGRARLAHLAQAAHGFLHGASRATRARALRAWLAAHGEPPSTWRDWAAAVERALVLRTRRHHRRRERRAARAGAHFALFGAGGVSGVRRDPEAPAAWEALATGWMGRDPPGATVLKASGRVLRAELPGEAGPCVLKRYAGVGPGRLPRPIAAFRRAVALAERGLDVAAPLLAVAEPGGAGVLVSRFVDAPDLLALTSGGRASAFAAWSPARRRACLRALGRALRRLHDAEVSHRDLKPGNLLVVTDPDGSFRFPLVDLEGARPRFATVSWRRRARDLGRLAASLPLSRAERLAVLAAYHAVLPRAPWDLRTLATHVHARAEAQRRRLRTRYGPAAVPTATPGGAPGPRG